MTRARRRSISGLGVAVLLSPILVSAQSASDPLGSLAACARVEHDAARLACFDALAAELEPARAAPAADAQREPSPARPAARVDAPAPRAVTPASPPRPATPTTPPPPATAAPPLPATAAAPPLPLPATAMTPPQPATASAARPAASAPEAVPIEAETRDGDDDTDDGFAAQTVTIVEVRSLPIGDTRFLTGDGRVMVQTSGSSRVRYPEVPFEAQLEEGALGALFLRIQPDGRRVRVAFRD